MDSLQKTALCLLFLSISSGAFNSEFASFNCSNITTEYNKTAVISCNSSKKITNVVVKRCESCAKETSCFKTVINTLQKKNMSEEGRIQLKLHQCGAEVHIQKVKATDQGLYKWYLYSDSGESHRCTDLEVTDITQEPASLMVHEGESVNITCSITNNGKLAGMYLKRVLVNAMEVLYIRNNSENHTVNLCYKTRIESALLSTGMRITLHSLQKNDTDLYVCQGSMQVNGDPRTVSGQGTMLVVKDMERAECHMASWVPYVPSFLTLLLVSVLGFLILSHINIKKHCQEGKKNQANMVYEDISLSQYVQNSGHTLYF